MTITNLEAEIAKAKKQAADRIKKLKREAAAGQRKIDAKVVELLREQDPSHYGRLVGQASDALAAEREKRSGNARRSTSVSAPTSPTQGSDTVTGADGLES